MTNKYEILKNDKVKALKSFNLVEKGSIGGFVNGYHVK